MKIKNFLLNSLVLLFLYLIISNGTVYSQNKNRDELAKGIIRGKVIDKESSLCEARWDVANT